MYALERDLLRVEQKVDWIMSALDDIKAANQAEAAQVTAVLAELKAESAEIATLTAQLATAAAGSDSADLAQLAADINTRAQTLAAGIAATHTVAEASPATTTAPATGVGATTAS